VSILPRLFSTSLEKDLRKEEAELCICAPLEARRQGRWEKKEKNRMSSSKSKSARESSGKRGENFSQRKKNFCSEYSVFIPIGAISGGNQRHSETRIA
jgi:hypothetical protein